MKILSTFDHTHTIEGPAGRARARWDGESCTVRCCKEARWLQNNLFFFLVCFLAFIKLRSMARTPTCMLAQDGWGAFSKDGSGCGQGQSPPSAPIRPDDASQMETARG